MSTKLMKTINDVREFIKAEKSIGKTVGFVPTMGYLHDGHRSLIKKARKENDVVVVSIFVNPVQFGPNEDLASYPRDLERDVALCNTGNVDLVFAPEKEEMYGEHFYSYAGVSMLTQGLCGKSRPTHFQGVCTVVMKLFHIVKPDRAYFGQKDAQQLCVLKRMVQDFNMEIEVIGCPIIREKDGLAMSSRNTYLSKEERRAALVLYKAISLAKEKVKNGEKNIQFILDIMKETIELEPLAKIDYLEAVDMLTLQSVELLKEDTLVAMAVYIGKTRLIDNCVLQKEAFACK